MGCDIHMSYQRIGRQQTRENNLCEILESAPSKLKNSWEYITDGIEVRTIWSSNYAQFSEEHRNYYWFGRMSEVRGDGPRITIPGLPKDSNNLVWEDYNLGDHSFCHVYLNTLVEEDWSILDKESMSTFINEDIPRMIEYCEREGLKPEEFRILIGYDS